MEAVDMSGWPRCLGPTSEVDAPSEALLDLLDLLRWRLGMDLAWLGRLDEDLLVL